MRSRIGAVLVLFALLAGSACSAKGDDASSDTTAAPPSETSPSTSATTDQEGELLDAIVIDDADLEPGQRAQLREFGDQVEDQVTLDYCGFSFASEAKRTARRQINVYAGDESIASNEAVLYEPGGAEQAMAEMRKAISTCPKDELADSNVAGVPDMTWSATPLDPTRLDGLTDDHIGVVITVKTEDGESQQQTMIFQRRGDLLVGSYGPDPDRTVALATAIGARIADVPGDQIGD